MWYLFNCTVKIEYRDNCKFDSEKSLLAQKELQHTNIHFLLLSCVLPSTGIICKDVMISALTRRRFIGFVLKLIYVG